MRASAVLAFPAVKPATGVRCLRCLRGWAAPHGGESRQGVQRSVTTAASLLFADDIAPFPAADSNFRAVTWECVVFFPRRSDKHTLTLQNGGHRMPLALIRVSQPQQPQGHRSDSTSDAITHTSAYAAGIFFRNLHTFRSSSIRSTNGLLGNFTGTRAQLRKWLFSDIVCDLPGSAWWKQESLTSIFIIAGWFLELKSCVPLSEMNAAPF